MFQIKQNQIYFNEVNLTNFMELKEINVDCETDTAFVTAVFKANVSGEYKAVVFAMLEELDQPTLIDFRDEVDRLLK